MFWCNFCVHFCSVVYAKTKQFSSHFHMLLRVRIYTSYYWNSILIVHLCVSSSPILTWLYVSLDWLVLYYCFVLWMIERQRLFLFSESFDTAWLFMSVVYVEVLKCGTFKDLYQTVLEYIGFNLKKLFLHLWSGKKSEERVHDVGSCTCCHRSACALHATWSLCPSNCQQM